MLLYFYAALLCAVLSFVLQCFRDRQLSFCTRAALVRRSKDLPTLPLYANAVFVGQVGNASRGCLLVIC